MTIITRYVNTGSTPGGNGTTNATTGSSRAYASLNSALDSSRTSVADGDEWLFECCGSAAERPNATISVEGWTIQGTGKITIRANRGAPDGFYSGLGSYSTSHYRIEPASDVGALIISNCNVTIDGLQFKATGSPSCLVHAAQNDSVRNTTITNCRLLGQSSKGIGLLIHDYWRTGTTNQIAYNNIIQSFGSGIYLGQTYYFPASVYIYNNTIINCDTGVAGPALLIQGAFSVRNNVLANCTAAITLSSGGGSILCDYNAFNASDKSNARGTAVTDWSTAFTDLPGGDYSVKPGSPLIGGGVSAAADSKVPGQDLLGRARAPGACDLGVFSFVTQTAIQEPVWSALSFV